VDSDQEEPSATGAEQVAEGKGVVRLTLKTVAVLGLVAALAHAGGLVCAEAIVKGEIFGNREAAEAIMKARSFDPRFCSREDADREKAVTFYQKAIALQPGAKMNAWIAARIAQLYAYYGDRTKGVRAEPRKALPWWQRCIQETNPRQLLWAEAQAGLGSASFLTGDPETAAEAFRAILALEPETMELPDWRVWPHGDTEARRTRLEGERARVRQKADRARTKAVDNLYYVLIRYDGAAAVSAMADIAHDHRGTAVAEQATKLLAKALNSESSSIYRYRGLPEAVREELSRLAELEEARGVSSAREARATVAGDGKPPGPAPAGAAGATEEPVGRKGARSPFRWSGGRTLVLALLPVAIVAGIAILILVRRAAVARRTA